MREPILRCNECGWRCSLQQKTFDNHYNPDKLQRCPKGYGTDRHCPGRMKWVKRASKS